MSPHRLADVVDEVLVWSEVALLRAGIDDLVPKVGDADPQGEPLDDWGALDDGDERTVCFVDGNGEGPSVLVSCSTSDAVPKICIAIVADDGSVEFGPERTMDQIADAMEDLIEALDEVYAVATLH